ncbi:GAF and ANTAR domain-containing protein [Lentzea sp. BCCO 10_0856]|uniref:GAF and ANTAR domain-containing protein n=1 Tax=Lentzea miocenica TaxID=3095431 RepID=A0ABU4T7C1_9PSEU|nr:GAF and ANTAR domain-containing protein [Lentzea sp. BCCO 10_0856]MDX8034067.1 GAF and ANTAR domain-containing protein [Lentzea sp. BCCO 10_0856]
MDGRSRDRLARAVEEFTSAVSGRAALAQALCAACLHVLPGVDAAALTLRANARAEEMVGASDEWAARLEEIQYTLGEGPGVSAFRDATPVLVADLGSDGVRWPGFSAAAAVEGLTAMFAFPLQVGGIRLGTLDLYRRRPGGLTAPATADAAMLADLATYALLEQSEQADEDQLRMTLSYQDVNMATGLLAAQLRISLEDAFARLRAHAFSSGRSVLDVARDLLARRIPLDRLAD